MSYRRILVVGLLLSILVQTGVGQGATAKATTIWVTTTANGGSGSLRQAILAANGQPGQQEIRFNIAAPAMNDVHLIQVESPLPPITGPVNINGRAGNTSMVELSGTLLNSSCAGVESGTYRDAPGFDIVRIDATGADASGTTVQGLTMSHFCEAIAVTAQVASAPGSCPATKQRITNVTIRDNTFTNNLGGNAAVDVCNTKDSVIRDNIFTNNSDHMELTRSQDVLVANNQGTGAQDAIELIRSHAITIRDNAFHGGTRSGITEGFGSGDSWIIDNELSDMPASGMVLGSNNVVRGNVVTGSGWYGIEVRGASGNQIHDNTISNNGRGGIAIYAGALLFLDGCTLDPSGNPVDCTVVVPLHEGGAYDNQVVENTITGNRGPGVVVGGVYVDAQGMTQTATRNAIVDNHFGGNHGLAIDLSDVSGSLFFAVDEPYVGAFGGIPIVVPDGPTPNDVGLQANDGQHYPTLTQIQIAHPTASTSPVQVAGTLAGNPGSTYRISVYASSVATSVADPAASFIAAEGEQLVGTRVVTTDGSGLVHFEVTVPAGKLLPCVVTDAAGDRAARGCLTSTATQLVANRHQLGSTSEFSSAIIIAN